MKNPSSDHLLESSFHSQLFHCELCSRLSEAIDKRAPPKNPPDSKDKHVSTLSTRSKYNAFSNQFMEFQKSVKKAIEDRKIFAINRRFPELRMALIQRGWIQKGLPGQEIRYGDSQAETDSIVELLDPVMPNLLWTKRYVEKDQYSPITNISRILREHNYNFTLKLGLTNIYNRLQWFDLTDSSSISFPRCYDTTHNIERVAFLNDFHLTSCTSFLHHLIKMKDLPNVFSWHGTITSECIKFAMRQVKVACDIKCNEDVDEDMAISTGSEMYRRHNKSFQSILGRAEQVVIIDGKTVSQLLCEVRALVLRAMKLFPQMRIDGTRNVWILKPGSSRRGQGIVIYNDEKRIMDFIQNNKRSSYVVQKYLECPLLIYNTKFDIRQFFIVTYDTNNAINIWMYKDCYLKFSGREFSLDNLTRSVHLTNHTVQKCYSNGVRNPDLPSHNMWSLAEFTKYLYKTGNAHVWEKKVYPGIVKCISTIVNASLDHVFYRRNSFELFGADFMISEQFDPILIEINASPDLAASTVTTRAICSAVVKDMVKVIADYSRNSRMPTGDFEKVWSVKVPNETQFCDLSVSGCNVGSTRRNRSLILNPARPSGDARTSVSAKVSLKRESWLQSPQCEGLKKRFTNYVQNSASSMIDTISTNSDLKFNSSCSEWSNMSCKPKVLQDTSSSIASCNHKMNDVRNSSHKKVALKRNKDKPKAPIPSSDATTRGSDIYVKSLTLTRSHESFDLAQNIDKQPDQSSNRTNNRTVRRRTEKAVRPSVAKSKVILIHPIPVTTVQPKFTAKRSNCPVKKSKSRALSRPELGTTSVNAVKVSEGVEKKTHLQMSNDRIVELSRLRKKIQGDLKATQDEVECLIEARKDFNEKVNLISSHLSDNASQSNDVENRNEANIN